jgi:hypothetical protein
MRTHQQIIKDIGGPAAIARVVGAEPGAAKHWSRLDSIPAKYWAALSAEKLATTDELATALARKGEAAA